MHRLLALPAALLALAAPSAAAHAATAPGRVLLPPTTTTVPEADVDAQGATLAVGLPDGGAILVGGRRAPSLMAITRSGALDAGFGTRGIARVTAKGFTATQLLRRPDGRLLLVGTESALAVRELPQLAVIGLTARGALDSSFGHGGIARPGIQGACASCAPAALQADGALLLAGATGMSTASVGGAGFDGVIARLTGAGTLDPTFGSAGLAAISGTGGYAVDQLPTGRILVLGASGNAVELRALTAAGAGDPTYTSVPITAELAINALFDASGRVDVVGDSGVTRITPTGAPDPAFGQGGFASFPTPTPGGFAPQVLPTADGGLLAAFRTAYDPGRLNTTPGLRVQRISPTGAFAAPTAVEPAFGGGLASTARSARIAPGLAQNGFAPAALLARPDGTFLLAGGVPVIRYTGEGAGFSAGYAAAASLTADLRPETSFGGPQASATLSVKVPAQHAKSDASLRRVLVTVKASGPGLALVRVRDGHRRVLAQSVEPVYAAGTTTLRIPPTPTGLTVLRRGTLRVSVGRAFTDLLAAQAANGSTVARLR